MQMCITQMQEVSDTKVDINGPVVGSGMLNKENKQVFWYLKHADLP